MERLSKILHPDLTLKDEDLSPFWNTASQELHALLWQPHKIESREPVTGLLNVLSNYREANCESWKKVLTMRKTSPQSRLLVSSQALSTLITESAAQSAEPLVITKKIRIYPENDRLFIEALHVFRRAYNLSIEAFKIHNLDPSSELRRQICDQIKSENPAVYDVNLIYEGYRKATVTRSRIIRKRKSGQICDYSFMSWKYSPRHFLCLKLGKEGSIYPKQLGGVYYSESLPEYSPGKNTNVLYKNGEWYACCQDYICINHITSEDKSLVACDPGVRNFITTFSDSQAKVYGEDFSKNRLVPLALRARKLISERQLLFNAKKKFKNPEDVPQVIYDQLRKVEKRLNKLRARKDHLVEDLHKRVAYDLLVENDIILLPTFNTSKMVKKGSRKIGRNTVAAMLDLNHYRFKLHLRWLAKKYGKVVIDVNEAYTSKTYNGRVMNNLGGRSSFKVPLVDGRSKVIGRDLNGARNILIRFVTTHT